MLTADELRRLREAATPTPWWGQYEYGGGRTVCQMRSTDTLFCLNMASHLKGEPYRKVKENAEFIAYLVNHAAEIEEALRDRERLAGSIRAAVTVLGEGECSINKCGECRHEHAEAVGILHAAIDAARKEQG